MKYSRGVNTDYMGKFRIINLPSLNNLLRVPSLKCEQKNDAFTKTDTTNGNGKLNDSIGLITADEMILAGGNFGDDILSSAYIKGSNLSLITFTPYSYNDGWFSIMFAFNNCNNTMCGTTNKTFEVKPVINLSLTYARQLTGNGTSTNPYILPES